MNLDDLLARIAQEKPKIVYLCGKTCVGKTTFATKLHDDAGYQVIDLDFVVKNDVIEPMVLEDEGAAFVSVYREDDRQDLIQKFVSSAQARTIMTVSGGKNVVIDGAISNPKTTERLLEPFKERLFVYFHPENLGNYINNITSRFMQATPTFNPGLPRSFWQLVDPAAFKEFCTTHQLSPSLETSIKNYASSSQANSLQRLEVLKQTFGDILVVNI